MRGQFDGDAGLAAHLQAAASCFPADAPAELTSHNAFAEDGKLGPAAVSALLKATPAPKIQRLFSQAKGFTRKGAATRAPPDANPRFGMQLAVALKPGAAPEAFAAMLDQARRGIGRGTGGAAVLPRFVPFFFRGSCGGGWIHLRALK